MSPRRRWALGAPLLTLVAAGCFATRGDVEVLQQDMQTLRRESARADSLHRAELDRVIRGLEAVRDSLGAVAGRFGRWQGEIRGDLQSVGEQLITIQELTGQSQRRLQELRADLEARSRAGGVTPTPAPGAGGERGAAAPSGAPSGAPSAADAGKPGPNEMLQIALDQLRRGSGGAARTALQDLLATYPDADVAPDAQYYLAESYATDGDEEAADQAYVEVFSRFPRSPRAPTALYKHGMILQNGGRTQEAREAFERIVRDYPRSDAAVLAKEQLAAPR